MKTSWYGLAAMIGAAFLIAGPAAGRAQEYVTSPGFEYAQPEATAGHVGAAVMADESVIAGSPMAGYAGGGAPGACGVPGGCGKPGCCPSAWCAGMYFSGEYLNWRPRTSVRPFAVVPVDVGQNTIDLELLDSSLDRDSGFRVEGGYITAGGWQIGFVYTRLETEGGLEVGQLGDDTFELIPQDIDLDLLDFNENLIADGVANFAAEFQELTYNVYDLEVGRNFRPDCKPNLIVRGFGGLRWARIDRDSLTTFSAYDVGTDIQDFDDIFRSTRMDGWGLRMGGSVNWAVGGSGVHVFARGAMALMLADFEISRAELAFNDFTGFTDATVLDERVLDVVPVLEIAAGLRYTCGCFFFSAGYEFTNWFNMVNDPIITNDGPAGSGAPLRLQIDRGDLSLEGFFASGGVSF